jgi:hypothetical protein
LCKYSGKLSNLFFFAKAVPAPLVVPILLLLLATNLMISCEGGKDRIALLVFNIFWIFVYYKCILSIGNPKMKSSHVNVLRWDTMGKTLIKAFFIENIVALDRQLSWSVLCISE